MLAAQGVKELLLISQDTSFYGIDQGERGGLAKLLRALNRVDGLEWIRMLYLYPTTIGNADRGIGSALPWAVAAIALVALIALVAGQRFSRSSVTAAPAPTDLPAASQSGSPPDISQMTPQERAERLYDRVMALNERGRADSVRFFAPMAMQAYTMLGRLNTDQRYDLGRIAAVSGDEQTARAQADTILSTQPQHLLGLLLAADAARLRGEQTREATYLRRFMAAAPAERAKQLPEYQQHVAEIDARLEKIRSR